MHYNRRALLLSAASVAAMVSVCLSRAASGAHICDDCIEAGLQHTLARRQEPITSPATPEAADAAASCDELLKPADVKAIPRPVRHRAGRGQTLSVAVAVYNHYKRLHAAAEDETGVRSRSSKSNIVLVGSDGNGQDAPRTHDRASSWTCRSPSSTPRCFTEAGYVGEDVESILSRLLQVADYDVAETPSAASSSSTRSTRSPARSDNPSDHARRQRARACSRRLLKILEGTVVNVPPQGRTQASRTRNYTQVDTTQHPLHLRRRVRRHRDAR